MSSNANRPQLIPWQYRLHGPTVSDEIEATHSELLAFIAQFRLRLDSDFDALFRRIDTDLQQLLSVRTFSCYYINDGVLSPHYNCHGNSSNLTSLYTRLTAKGSADVNYANDNNHAAYIIYHKRIPLFLIYSSRTKPIDNLFTDYFMSIVHALSGLINAAYDRTKSSIKDRLAHLVFANPTIGHEAWRLFTAAFETFLPPFPHFALYRKTAAIQLLVYDVTGSHFTIMSTVRSDGLGKIVLADRSVIGLAITHPGTISTYNRDDVAERYQSFSRTAIQFELVSKIVYQNELIGVLNIETPVSAPFSVIYIAYVKMFCKLISYYMAGLLHRINDSKIQDLSLMYVFTDMANDAGSTFGHIIAQPSLAVKTTAYNTEQYLARFLQSRNLDDIHSALRNVRDTQKAFADVETELEVFINDLPRFVYFGDVDIRDGVARRLRSYIYERRRDGIAISIARGIEFKVYASTLFLQHLFDLVTNSVQAVQSAMLNGFRDRGRIRISFRRRTDRDYTRKLTGISYIQIIISDNGSGMDPEHLVNYGKHGYTTKPGGHGFGVWRARRYCELFNGSLVGDNRRQKGAVAGFKTVASLVEFDPRLHQAGFLADLLKKRVTDGPQV